ncbi:restriction endonuclease subunit S [Acinetobacter soli]|uniref:restriction endonuclease subunit S n=1 Tax=Acinetobacter soli TaxID=487316 RepID=UPI0032B4CA64
MSNLKNVVKLSDLAEIRTGFTFREKIEEIDSGNAHLAQIKDVRSIRDVTQSQRLYVNELPQIHWDGKTNSLIDTECVLLPCRGEYYKASYFVGRQNPAELPLIVSSQFLILFANKQKLLPEYLCWYLNQPIAQYELRQESQGSNISMLTVASAGQFKIPIPTLEIQQQIIQLNNIWEEEQVLSQKLLRNREIMMQGMFQQLLKGNK